MARIALKSIYHSYTFSQKDAEKMSIPDECVGTEGFVVEDLDLLWEDGTANALLGPSGCGKTTILNIISGLLRPTNGTVLFNDKNVTGYMPKERHVAQVFQFPVVYDTMNVYGNLEFPLENRGVSKKDIRRRIETIAEMLDLDDKLKAPIGSLTPAEKQKVSLGRGIVREDTAAILLDEPLTVIDPKEKWGLRRKLREVQKELRITMIYVTHDQHEALTFADHVTVVKEGQLVQTGSPEQLYADPNSPFIGYFIGTPGMNLFDCVLTDAGLQSGNIVIPISEAIRSKLALTHGSSFQFGIRPEFVQISAPRKEKWHPFTVTAIESLGPYKILTLNSNDVEIKSRAPEDMNVSEEDHVWVNFPEDKSRIFHKDVRLV
ncbi:MAG: ABC transporter ATP-binding protein [Desulfobacteraceae bacterium]|nr:ABC transporter ATP-binding protein [Desulfobacteraceae bacterium]